MDEELVEATEGGVLGRRGVGRGAHDAPPFGLCLLTASGSGSVRIAAAQYARPVAGDQRGDERIDPREAAFFARPDYYDVLARLRAEEPVHQCEPGFWVLSRYGDIRDLSRDPQRFCSGRGALVNDPLRARGNPMGAPSLLHMDPPEHTSSASWSTGGSPRGR